MLKVALFDKNPDYVKHFCHTAKTVYGEQMEVVTAEDAEAAKELLASGNPDVVLVDSKFPWVSVKECLKLYLVEKKDTDAAGEVPTVHKFQKFGNILESITGIHADYQAHPEKYPAESKTTKVVAFVSAAGGTGKSTLAMAYARRYAAGGEDVVFLSLESYSSLPMVFRCEGEKTLEEALSDVTEEQYGEKVGQLIQREHKGVYYIEPAGAPLSNSMSMVEKMRHLIAALSGMDAFDKIVVELGDASQSLSRSILEEAAEIMLVTGESDVAFHKTARLVKEFLEEEEQWIEKMALLVNKARMNMPVSGDMEKISRRYQIGSCGNYRLAKAVELLTPQMQMIESI